MILRAKYLIASLVFFLGISPAFSGELVVVVNAKNPVKTISKEEVRKAFLRTGRRSWSELGKRIVPIDHRNNDAVRAAFCEKVLNLSCKEYDAEMIKLTYRSAGDRIKKMGNDAGVLLVVGLSDGAIGYVSKSSLSASKAKTIKPVLSVPY